MIERNQSTCFQEAKSILDLVIFKIAAKTIVNTIKNIAYNIYIDLPRASVQQYI